MIRVIYGKKGSGKTKRMLAMANDLGARADGSIAFIDVDKDYMYDLDRSIRFIDASEYSIFGADMFLGFIKGIAAQDFDLQHVTTQAAASPPPGRSVQRGRAGRPPAPSVATACITWRRSED